MELFEQLERYYDAVPRTAAVTEDIGPFVLFIPTGAWPYYARPRRGLDRPVTASDVLAVRERQRALAIPETFEWVAETTPSLAEACTAAGLVVRRSPLLVFEGPTAAAAPAGTWVRRVPADEPRLDWIQAVLMLGFGSPGTDIGVAGPAERDRSAAELGRAELDFLRERIQSGLTVLVVAEGKEGPLAAGSHQPVGGVSEVVGVATLPSARRRGLAAAVTAALVEDARARKVELVFLSAGSDAVARVYERVGFRRVGMACSAEPPV